MYNATHLSNEFTRVLESGSGTSEDLELSSDLVDLGVYLSIGSILIAHILITLRVTLVRSTPGLNLRVSWTITMDSVLHNYYG